MTLPRWIKPHPMHQLMSPVQIEAFEERVAILQYCSGMLPDESELAAYRIVMGRPYIKPAPKPEHQLDFSDFSSSSVPFT